MTNEIGNTPSRHYYAVTVELVSPGNASPNRKLLRLFVARGYSPRVGKGTTSKMYFIELTTHVDEALSRIRTDVNAIKEEITRLYPRVQVKVCVGRIYQEGFDEDLASFWKIPNQPVEANEPGVEEVQIAEDITEDLVEDIDTQNEDLDTQNDSVNESLLESFSKVAVSKGFEAKIPLIIKLQEALDVDSEEEACNRIASLFENRTLRTMEDDIKYNHIWRK